MADIIYTLKPFIKQAMLIGSGSNSIITTEAFEISGEYDMDSLGGVMSFSLPYIPLEQRRTVTAGIDMNNIKKFDTVKLYFGSFDKDIDLSRARNEADLTALGLTKLFDGFVDTVKLSKAKDSYEYSFEALTTVGLANYRTLEWQKKNDLITSMVPSILELSGLKGVVPFKTDIPGDRIPVSLDGGKTAKDMFMQIREKYAIILHQGPDGWLRMSSPEFFKNNATFVAYQFDFKSGNIFDLDYGDWQTNYNAVLCMGFGNIFGIALDAIGVQNNGNQVNYYGMENRDLKSNEDCETVARNKLLEFEKNYSISFKTILNPNFNVGQCFQIKDYDKYTGKEKFMIKKWTFNVSKTDVSATITGYTHSLTMLPEDVVLKNTGIADIDTLGLREKVTDLVDWNLELTK